MSATRRKIAAITGQHVALCNCRLALRVTVLAAAALLIAAPNESRAQSSDAPTAEQLQADARLLELLIENNHAYYWLKPFDYTSALRDLVDKPPDTMTRDEFALELRKIVARFGDGHSRVRGWFGMVPRGYTPFAMGACGKRVVVMTADRERLLDADHPYLETIDGLPLQDWLDAASVIVADGSPQFVHRGSVEVLHCIRFVRRELGLEPADSIRIELTNDDRSSRIARTMQVEPRPPRLAPEVPETLSRILDGNIGYLRIGEMNGSFRFLGRLVRWMQDLRNTSGLIIDVRGNTGGSRAVLVTLLPYLMSCDDTPRIANVARYRLNAGDEPDRADGYLHDRYLYPLTSTRWTHEERKAIETFARSFKPEPEPPAKGFSEWHYMVIAPARTPQHFHYDKPVIVLMDSASYSATDVFLGGLKGISNVTLMGEPSGGGSGRATQHWLAFSRLRVRLSTMVSYQPNGLLYDGNGVTPDVLIHPTPTDLIGTTDSMLDAAVRRLTDRRSGNGDD